MIVYVNHEGEIEREQKSRMKSSLITMSNTAHLYMPISNATYNEPSLTVSRIQEGFLAENAFCIFLFVCVFTFPCFMFICIVMEIFLMNIHFIIPSDFPSILQAGFF